MKIYLILLALICAGSLSGMIIDKSSERESYIAPKDKKDIHDFLKNQRTRSQIIYTYLKNGQELTDTTTRIYYPSRDHKLIIPCENNFAILLKASLWKRCAINPEFISEINHRSSYQCDAARALPHTIFIFRTTAQQGLSQLQFQDLTNDEKFIVTIINN